MSTATDPADKPAAPMISAAIGVTILAVAFVFIGVANASTGLGTFCMVVGGILHLVAWFQFMTGVHRVCTAVDRQVHA